jgi:hypothetical protein
MKSIAALMLCVPVSAVTQAQGAFNNETQSTLQKVIADYQFQFRNIRETVLRNNPPIVQYASKVKIADAVSCIVSESARSNSGAYSWECLVLRTSDHAAASRKYKELFDQINNSIIRIEGEKSFILNGSPSISSESTSSYFHLLPAIGVFQKLEVKLSMQKENQIWVINLTVRDREDLMASN